MVESSAMGKIDTRKLMNMISQKMRDRKTTIRTAAFALGIAENTLSHKINNASFSLKEFLAICDFVGIELMWRDTGYFDARQPSSVKSHRIAPGVVDE